MNTVIPQLIETYDRDEYSLYGLWRISTPEGAFDVGCVIGVRLSDRYNCQASGAGVRPFLHAWYADSSDWITPYEKQLGLEALFANIATLWTEHGAHK